MLFHGDNPELFLEVYEPRIHLESGEQGGSRLLVLGARLRVNGNHTHESVLRVWGSSLSEGSLESVYRWLDEMEEVSEGSLAEVYGYVGASTDVHRHEPFGVLESRLEALRMPDDGSGQYDWYDLTVTQSVTPGAWGGSSMWRWSWVEYTMNGSAAGSNVYLSDYDQPAASRAPIGLFTLLWRIVTFQWRDLLPQILSREQGVEGLNMSDFSRELFMVRYEAYGGFDETDRPFKARHRYILRVDEGAAPRFWHQTQVKYVKGGALSVERHITPPIAGGYISIQP